MGLVAALVAGPASQARAATYYVDASAGSDANAGTSWATAYKSVSNAVVKVTTGEEIWVAAGTYTHAIAAGMIVSNHTLLGGYPSGGGPRDPVANPTILDGQAARRSFQKTVAGTFTLDGFTVRNGSYANGGAIYVTDVAGSALNIRNCIFENNSTSS